MCVDLPNPPSTDGRIISIEGTCSAHDEQAGYRNGLLLGCRYALLYHFVSPVQEGLNFPPKDDARLGKGDAFSETTIFTSITHKSNTLAEILMRYKSSAIVHVFGLGDAAAFACVTSTSAQHGTVSYIVCQQTGTWWTTVEDWTTVQVENSRRTAFYHSIDSKFKGHGAWKPYKRWSNTGTENEISRHSLRACLRESSADGGIDALLSLSIFISSTQAVHHGSGEVINRWQWNRAQTIKGFN